MHAPSHCLCYLLCLKCSHLGPEVFWAVPFGTMFALVLLWFGISVPCVFVGGYAGFKKSTFEDPVKTNKIPRQISEHAWYMNPIFSLLIGGILPFGAVFIELFFVLTSIWLFHRLIIYLQSISTVNFYAWLHLLENLSLPSSLPYLVDPTLIVLDPIRCISRPFRFRSYRRFFSSSSSSSSSSVIALSLIRFSFFLFLIFVGGQKSDSIYWMEENYEKLNKTMTSHTGISDVVLYCVMPYIEDPKDRDAVSLVCRHWYEIDALTRKHITIALCYTTSPDRLRRRFQHLESLKLKGKPRAAMFNLIPEDWGGYVTPWMKEIAENFNCLKSVHFRRMIVTDSDLEVLARSRGKVLQVLKLDKCSGFSTDGLLHVGRLCRQLRTLFLEESSIFEKDGEWLHEIAINNSVLETLNFYMTELDKVSFEDLELIARNCSNLASVKISDYEILDLVGFFRAAAVLEEFCGGSFNEQSDRYDSIKFPPRLCRLGLTYMGKNEMPIVFPFASLLKKLDLLYALLDTEDHCLLIQRCPNLEVLETRNVIGDRGLEVLARSCKRLKRLRIERGADEQGMDDEEGLVSQRGLMALAQGCLELEYMAVYVSDISNESLIYIGTYSKNLCDFRLVLLDREERITDLPLDNGVQALLRGCEKLRRFALYLRPGGLTDVGLRYVGQYSPNIRWMLLGCVGESDAGILEFSKGCPSLQKLEMRGCCFSEHALAVSVMQLTSLRYLWVQGYRASSPPGRDLLAMARPFWNIELIPARRVVRTDDQVGETVVVEHPAHILAYYSLAGPRTDFPDTVIPLATSVAGVEL